MGMVLSVMDWDWTGADQEYRRALELKPSLTLARMTYASACLVPLGRYEEAIGQLRQALTNDPFALSLRAILAQTLVWPTGPTKRSTNCARSWIWSRATPLAASRLHWPTWRKDAIRDAIEALMVVREAVGDLPNYSGYLGYAHAKLAIARKPSAS